MGHKPYHKIEPKAFVVVHDPDPLGGFRAGAEINIEQARYMMYACVNAFTIGTILKNKCGKQFKVIRKKGGGQALKPI
jgi:hypothetical protein